MTRFARSVPAVLMLPPLLVAAAAAGNERPGASAGGVGCVVTGAAGTAADARRARAACERARARFAELFDEPVPAVRIVLWERPGYRAGTTGDGAAIYWPTEHAMAERAAAATAARGYIAEQWRDVLPHEAMHALLAAYVRTGERYPAPTDYGTALPDWLDEGVAIWGESLQNRSARLARARGLPHARLDLRSILTATHPAADDSTAAAIRQGEPPPRGGALRTFYAQAIAVVAFVHDAGGSSALRELTRRLTADPTLGPAALERLPGLPSDFERVESAWMAWLADRRAGVAPA